MQDFYSKTKICFLKTKAKTYIFGFEDAQVAKDILQGPQDWEREIGFVTNVAVSVVMRFFVLVS